MIAMIRCMRLGLTCAGILFLASGCESLVGNDEVPPPVGIGTELDELKRSPCACLEIPQDYHDWRRRS